MLVLLPPSEGKADGANRASLDLARLQHPELTAARELVLDALVRIATGPAGRAHTVLGLTAGQSGELERDVRLRSAPTSPAREIYSGVLFEAVGFAALSQRARRRLDSCVWVQSALFGLVSLADPIPAYRLSAGTVLPRVGNVNRVWAPLVTPILAQHEGLLIDLRSSAYTALGPLPRGCDAVVPRVLQRMRSGPPKVVTHSNKATKGRILRAIAVAPRLVSTAEGLAELVAGLGADVTLRKGSGPAVLDVVVDAL